MAGVLLQDVQGLGLGAGFAADAGAGTGLLAVLAPGGFAAVGGEGIAGGQVGACGKERRWHSQDFLLSSTGVGLSRETAPITKGRDTDLAEGETEGRATRLRGNSWL